MLKDAQARVTTLLVQHRAALDALATALVENETLDEGGVRAAVARGLDVGVSSPTR